MKAWLVSPLHFLLNVQHSCHGKYPRFYPIFHIDRPGDCSFLFFRLAAESHHRLIKSFGSSMWLIMCVAMISRIATQLHPAASATSMTHSRPWMAITVLSIPAIAVTIFGVTFSILMDATTSEHLICGSHDDHLKTRCSFASRSSSSIEF